MNMSEEIKIFVDINEDINNKVMICQSNADKLGVQNGATIEVYNPDNQLHKDP